MNTYISIKKSIMGMLLILCVSSLAFTAGNRENNRDNANKKTIIVGTEGTYKPYSYHDKSGALTGYDVEVVKAIATISGYKIKFVEARWDGLLTGLKSNRWNIVANQVWRNEAREKEYLLSDKYLSAGASVLVLKDSGVTTFADLQGKKAAVSLTSSFRPYVEEITNNIEFQDDFILAADLLVSGRVDFVVNDTQTIGVYIKEHPNTNVKAIKLNKVTSTDVVLALNKNNKDLLTEVNTALAELKQNGTLDDLKQKYFAGVE